jgi:glycine/D-amino acid oxidase-like deaminating enzyme
VFPGWDLVFPRRDLVFPRRDLMRLIGDEVPATADVVVVGAGIVGAACARALALAGRSVCVLDRDGPAAGTSSSGEGNLLVSDKLPGPELDLALHSLRLWARLAASVGADLGFEFEAKGGLVVADSPGSLAGLETVAAGQRAAGIVVDGLDVGQLAVAEPSLAPDLAGGAYYPQDCQVQPMLAARALLAEAVRAGARVVGGAEVVAADRGRDGVTRVRTGRGVVCAPAVVVAAGVWSPTVARLLGGRAPVVPRRGHVVVTEALPPLIHHKVYEAGYVSDVGSDGSDLLCSAVVEGTASGPVLLGSSRELAGFDRRLNPAAVAGICRRAARLFPFLRDVRAIRAYLGLRPASPDHLPIIGPDADAPGLWHATGHEGAGVGLALGTADLLSALITGEPAPLDPAPFAPSRPTLRTVADAPLGERGRVRSVAEAVTSPRAPAGTAPVGSATVGSAPVGSAPVGAAPTRQSAGSGELTFGFEGRALGATPGASIGAALWSAGVRHFRTTRTLGRPRGLYCGIGQCFDCLVRVGDGPPVRACLTAVHDGDEVSRGDADGGQA